MRSFHRWDTAAPVALLPDDGIESILPHQSGDTLVVDDETCRTEFSCYPVYAIGVVMSFLYLPDPVDNIGVIQCLGGDGPLFVDGAPVQLDESTRLT